MTDLGDTSGPPNEHHLVDLLLVHVRVLQHLLHGGHGLLEEVHVQLFELGTRERDAEVDALVDGLDLSLLLWRDNEWSR